MSTIEEILEMAQGLPADERCRLILELRKSEDARDGHAESVGDRVPDGAYDALIEIAGSAHSEYEDVSSNKNKHLAEAYADKR